MVAASYTTPWATVRGRSWNRARKRAYGIASSSAGGKAPGEHDGRDEAHEPGVALVHEDPRVEQLPPDLGVVADHLRDLQVDALALDVPPEARVGDVVAHHRALREAHLPAAPLDGIGAGGVLPAEAVLGEALALEERRAAEEDVAGLEAPGEAGDVLRGRPPLRRRVLRHRGAADDADAGIGERRQALAQPLRLRQAVRVGVGDHRAAGAARGLVAHPADAAGHLLEADRDVCGARELEDHLLRAVRRAVVDDEHLEARMVELEARPQAALHLLPPVLDRHGDGDLDLPHGGGIMPAARPEHAPCAACCRPWARCRPGYGVTVTEAQEPLMTSRVSASTVIPALHWTVSCSPSRASTVNGEAWSYRPR